MNMAGEEVPMMFYANWYNDDVRKHLTKKQKEDQHIAPKGHNIRKRERVQQERVP